MAEILSAFAIGAVTGALLFGIVVARNWSRTLHRICCVVAVGQLDVARRIKAGESEELVQQILDSIPQYVATVQSGFESDGATSDALYATRRFYEATDLDIPDGIRETVAAVPQRAITCYKLTSPCSTGVSCLPIPTSLRPVSNTKHPRGWEKGKTLCGVKKGWIWSTACGAPLTIGSC